jgi:uncharacterized membrane protein YoaT (DUF817 family)
MVKKKKIHGAGGQGRELSPDQSHARSKIGVAASINIDRYQALYLVVLVAVGCLIYANTFQSPFIFDDEYYIKNNPAIRLQEFSWTNIITAVSGTGRNRPVSTLSFAFNYYAITWLIFSFILSLAFCFFSS